MKVSIKKQTNIIDVPEEGAAHLLEITSDGYFKYEVNYRTDPRKAVQNKSILVKIMASTKALTIQPNKILTQFNPDQLIKNILQKSSTSKDQSRGQVSNVFFTYMSDISSKIPNDKTTLLTLNPTIQTLLPQVVLKKDRLVKLKSVQEITNTNIIMPVLENNISLSIVPPDLVRNTSVAKTVSLGMVTKRGIDPAQISGAPTRTIQSARNVSSGMIAQPSQALTKLHLNDNQKVSFVGNLVNPINPTNHLQLRPTDFVNVLVDSPRTTLDIQEYLYIPTGMLQLDEFFLVFQLTNNVGIPVQTITITVPHSKNVANLQIPTVPPKMVVLQTGLPGRNIVQVKQMDPNAVGVAVYRKEIKKSVPVVDAAFTFIGNVNAKYGEDFQRMEDAVNNFNTILYRAIPYNTHNIKAGEFTSAGALPLKRPHANKYDRKHNFVSVLGEVVSNAISVEIRNVPPGVCLVKLQKRNLTTHEQDFTLVAKPSLITNEETSAPIFVTDNDIQEDRIYEYQVLLLYPDGTEEIGANNLVIKYEPVTANIVETTVTKPTVVQSGTDLDVQFNLASSLIPTNLDLIKSTLDKQGLLSFFQDAVGNEKEKLQNIIAYNVKRTNVTTGEVEDFGIVSDANFSDKKYGQVQGVKNLEPGYEYRYTVTTYFRSAETTLTAATRSVSTSQNQSYTLQPSKWFHPVTLKKGNVVSDKSLARNHSQNVFSFGAVGNIVTTNVSLANILPSVAQASAQKFGKGSILVQWRVQGRVTKIDHFIVILEMMGMRTVVGKSHNVSESNYFQFVDTLTDGEHGKLTYYIVPVFYDFTRGTEITTNEVVI